MLESYRTRIVLPAIVAAMLACCRVGDAQTATSRSALPSTQVSLSATRPASRPAGAQSQQPDAAAIEQALRELRSDKYAVRQQAKLRLWNYGPAAREALEQAASSGDANVSDYAAAILDLIVQGIYPDTPPEVAKLVRRFHRITDRHHNTYSQHDSDNSTESGVIEELWAMHTPAADRSRIALLAASENEASLLTIVTVAIVQDLTAGKIQETQALANLESLAMEGWDSSIQHYVAFCLVTGRLDEKVKQLLQTPSKKQWKILAYMYRAKDDLPAAARAAHQAGDDELEANMLAEMGDWSKMARLPDGKPPVRELQRWGFMPTPIYGYWADLWRKAVACQLAGDSAGLEQAVKKFEHLPDDEDQKYAFQLSLGRVDHALELAAKNKDFDKAFAILRAQMKYAQANAMVEKAKAWLPKDKPKPGEEDDEARGLRQRYYRLLIEQAGMLLDLGQSAKAGEVLAAVLAEAVKTHDFDLASSAVEAVASGGAKDLALDLAQKAISQLEPDGDSDDLDVLYGQVAEAAFADSSGEVTLLWCKGDQRIIGEEYPERFAGICRFLDGSMPLGQRHALVSDLLEQIKTDRPQPHGRYAMMNSDRLQDATKLQRLCSLSGMEEMLAPIANMIDAETVRTFGADPQSVLWPMVERQQWQEIEDFCSRADGSSFQVLLARAIALAKLNRPAEAQAQYVKANVLSTAFSGAREWLASQFEDAGLEQWAADQRRLCYLLRDAADGAALAQLPAVNHTVVAKYFNCEKAGATDEPTQLSYGVLAHLHTALGHLQAGRLDKALQQADAAFALNPADTELPVGLVPELDRLGHKQEAQQVFDRYWNYLDSVRAQAEGPTVCNAMAWLGAKCRRNLPRSLELAQAAVRFRPESIAFQDTLAEALVQTGRADEAYKLVAKAIEAAKARGLDDDSVQMLRKRLPELKAATMPASRPAR